MFNQKLKINRYILIFSLLITIILTVLYLAGIRVNTSSSYPPGLYLVSEANQYKENDLVLFCPPPGHAMTLAMERRYIDPGHCPSGTTPVMKRIIALAGDQIEFTPTITVNGEALPDSIRLSVDSLGRPLPQLASFTVPEQAFFAYSEHAPRNSFDSRYYGAVPLHNIIGHIRPLLLFPQ